MNAVTPLPASVRAPPAAGIVPAIQITTFGELMRFAEMAAPTDLMPRDYKGKPGNIVIAVQMGSELGLSPMQSLSNISVINGRASVWGDALLGLVRKDPRCEDVIETITGDGEARTATCIVKRQGSSPTRATFSVADAKKAALWGKQGPWQQYPDRMLQMRARGFACRDAFPDVLRGLITAEEARDTPRDEYTGTTLEHAAEPAPASAPPPVQVDHVALLQARLAKCHDADRVVRTGEHWNSTVKRASVAGRPISEDVQAQVTELLADALGRFDVEAPTHDEDAMPE